MKANKMLPIILLILLFYVAIHVFVGRSILQSLHDTTWARSITLVVYILLGSGWIISTFLIRNGINGWLVNGLHEIGSYWLALFFYFVLLLGLLWLIRLMASQLQPLAGLSDFLTQGHRLVLAGGLALAITLGGAINARGLVVREYSVPPQDTTTRLAPEAVPPNGAAVNIVFFADLHIGSATSLDRLREIVARANTLKPDLILIAGDIIDMSPEDDGEGHAAKILSGLKAGLGVYACPGNHEYILQPERSFAWIRSAGIQLLDDEAILTNGLVIAGRRDWAASTHGLKRSSLSAILEPIIKTQTNSAHQLIVLDHQPRALDEAAKAGASLVLSGHTHHGQLWPINWITSTIFENSHGMIQKGSTSCITTSGISVWGPQVRTSSTPEIVLIRMSRGK